MIDSTFIEAVADLGKKSETPHVVKVNDDLALVVIDGTAKEVYVKPPRRKHTAKDLSAIVAFAKGNKGASVWYSAFGATCLIDDIDRRDEIKLTLTMSPQMTKLMEWDRGANNTMKQEQAVKILRTMFRDCLGRAGDLLGIMKSLKFKQNAQGAAAIDHGKASYSKGIDQELTGAGSIPEWFSLDVPVFACGFPCVEGIDVAIWIDCPNETFTFIPIPGAVNRAIEAAEQSIGESLEAALDGESKLYFGSP